MFQGKQKIMVNHSMLLSHRVGKDSKTIVLFIGHLAVYYININLLSEVFI